MAKKKGKEGLVPVRVKTKAGHMTTVYKRPEELNGADKEVSKSLGEKSLKKNEEKKLTFEDFDIADGETGVEDICDTLEEEPEAIHEPEFRAYIADTGAVINSEIRNLEKYRVELKERIINSFTDKQIANGTIKKSADGQFEVEVEEGPSRFDPSKANLTTDEMKECSESSIDHNLIQKEFPETYHSIGTATGGFHVSSDNYDAEDPKNKRINDALNERMATRIDEQRKKSESMKQSELINEYIAVEDEVDYLNDRKKEFKNAILNASVGDESLKVRGNSYGAAMKKAFGDTPGANTFHNPKTGASMSIKPNMTYDTSQFLEARIDHYESNANYNQDDEKVQRIAHRRAMRDWSRVQVMKIRADKVKEKYPKKYEAGKPPVKTMYINEPSN